MLRLQHNKTKYLNYQFVFEVVSMYFYYIIVTIRFWAFVFMISTLKLDNDDNLFIYKDLKMYSLPNDQTIFGPINKLPEYILF